jgi:hypothetical protein
MSCTVSPLCTINISPLWSAIGTHVKLCEQNFTAIDNGMSWRGARVGGHVLRQATNNCTHHGHH